MKQRVLFVCEANPSLAIMAEAFLRAMAGNDFNVASAAVRPEPAEAAARQVMKAHDLDIDGIEPSALDAVRGQPWEYLIVLGEHESQSEFPAAQHRWRWSVEVPASGDRAGYERAAKRLVDDLRQFLDQTGSSARATGAEY